MQYPKGAIKTVDELFEAASNGISIIYYASAMEGMEEELNIMSINLAQMLDGNIGRLNNYNDWFMFVDKAAAKAFLQHQMEE